MADVVNLDINLVYLRLFSSGIGAYFLENIIIPITMIV
jgi:hypothetical protein